MKYKIKNFLKIKTIHNKIKQTKFYNFKLFNKNFICFGLLPTNKKYFRFIFFIKNKVNKSVNRNFFKRLFKEYVRVFQCNLINLYISLYIIKCIFNILSYIFFNNLLIKLISF
ncbi:hypothetical protein SISI_0021 [Candidatus Portiera aleyrodidarum]|uniref:Uncharacterized protein n=1 Tax=Candidatus Portiera aleyrodidarum TaxID=91844 RepID=A0A6S6S3X3_9GAMM|nr:ribonuclease P protein component [Candidatus Portiera aleyrodidarum]CAA3704315.1 hypothetical protein SISI_0021 [Candidatus Portiera aleyrodidarum]